jgi:hypothetical protein
VIETEFDREVAMIQQLKEAYDRTIHYSVGYDGPVLTPEKYIAEILQLSEASITEARAEADRAQEEADSAKAEADRAELASGGMLLESGVYNVRRIFTAPATVASGGILTLPLGYYPTRNVLWFSYKDAPCSPKQADSDGTSRYQYEEVGNDPNVLSFQMRMSFAVQAGDKFDMWVVTSAAGKNLDAQEALVAEARAEADRAQAEAAPAAESAEAASASEANAGNSETAAAASATAAGAGAGNAATSALAAMGSEENAAASASAAMALEHFNFENAHNS